MSAYGNNSRKRTAQLTDTFSIPEGVRLPESGLYCCIDVGPSIPSDSLYLYVSEEITTVRLSFDLVLDEQKQDTTEWRSWLAKRLQARLCQVQTFFFFVRRSWHAEYHIFHIQLLKIHIFLYFTHYTVDIVDPSSMQDFFVSNMNLVYGPALYESLRSSVDHGAPVRCSGGHRFESCRGLRFFLCPTLVTC